MPTISARGLAPVFSDVLALNLGVFGMRAVSRCVVGSLSQHFESRHRGALWRESRISMQSF
jgi:hypothetical protein